MTNNKILIGTLACLAVMTAGYAGVNKVAPTKQSEEDIKVAEILAADSIARVRQDSLEIAQTEALNARVAATYKNLKTVQYDGVTERELYPKVMETYDAVREAMKAPRATDEDLANHRKMLRELSNMIINGAVFYSGEQNMEEFKRFAKTYVNLRLSPDMQDVKFPESADRVYPMLLYNTASLAYNAGNFDEATLYMKAYIDTGAKDYRQYIFNYLGQAAINSGKSAEFAGTLLIGAEEYPADFTLQQFAIQNCLKAGEIDLAAPVVEKALMLQPDNEALLKMHGQILESRGQYADALVCFEKLVEMKPQSLNYNKHLGLDYFNMGVEYYNRSINEADEKKQKRYQRQSNAYFLTAADRLAEIVHNEPANAKYLRALAHTYAGLGQKDRLEEVNVHLAAIGQPTVKINDMPPLISEEATKAAARREIPDFQTFALKERKALDEWKKKGEFETSEKFAQRVTKESADARERELSKEAEKRYIDTYARNFRITDMKLHEYDPDNETYKVSSSLGDFVLRVPVKNGEAERFKSQWDGMQVSNPKYFIDRNRVAIAAITLKAPGGKAYTYNSEKAAKYDYTPIVFYGTKVHESADNAAPRTKVVYPKSDVDEDIPIVKPTAGKTLALVIANENYQNVGAVEFAINDGERFREYCTKVLGIPEDNVMYYSDCTLGPINNALYNLRQRVEMLGDDVDIIVYYAGHGFPDEDTKDAYLLPVDGDAMSTKSAISLKKFYSELAESGARDIMVFLDACFSGNSRDDKNLVAARGVELKPRAATPEGNMFVLSATSDKQTALPYREKYHGLFTYYLLKKLRESKGKVTLQQLSDYVKKSVGQASVTVNKKIQIPSTALSGTMRENWSSRKMRQ